jgi:hypothetical protein
LEAAGHCGIPPGAKAVAANFTVVGPGAAGELWVGPHSAGPFSTAVGFGAGQVRAGNAIVRLATDGSGGMALTASTALATDLVIDVSGYFE